MLKCTTEPPLAVDTSLFFQSIEPALARGEQLCIPARGNSMYPLIRGEGDQLLIRAVTLPPKPGDILAARLSTGRYVMHRLLRVEGDWLILRGDNSLYHQEYCQPGQLVAELLGVIRPSGKQISKGSWLWRLYRWGRPSSPLLRMPLRILRKIWQIGSIMRGRKASEIGK